MAGSSSLSLLWEVFASGQRVKQLVESAMAGSPLTPEEYAVYSVLFDLGPKAPTELAATVGMPPTTMSHHVRALIERGHAVRQPTPGDGRSYRLALTADGLAVHREAGRHFQAGNQRFVAALEVEESFLAGALREIGRAADLATGQLSQSRRRAAG
jgi:DNA-binding MarR family transcriptional regulator